MVDSMLVQVLHEEESLLLGHVLNQRSLVVFEWPPILGDGFVEVVVICEGYVGDVEEFARTLKIYAHGGLEGLLVSNVHCHFDRVALNLRLLLALSLFAISLWLCSHGFDVL